jgi:hypothetical protein
MRDSPVTFNKASGTDVKLSHFSNLTQQIPIEKLYCEGINSWTTTNKWAKVEEEELGYRLSNRLC